jgi:hypothetical protein
VTDNSEPSQHCTCGNMSGYVKDHATTCSLRSPMPRPKTDPTEAALEAELFRQVIKAKLEARAYVAYVNDLLEVGYAMSAALKVASTNVNRDRDEILKAIDLWESVTGDGSKSKIGVMEDALLGVRKGVAETEVLVKAARALLKSNEQYRNPVTPEMYQLAEALQAFP